MRVRHAVLALGSLLLLPLAAQAQSASPVGTWQQVDDDSGKVTSIIEITDNNGELRAKVLKVMNMTPEQIARDGQPPRCTQCDGPRKDQPIEGMTIMWGVHKDGDHWSGGQILDPSSGKTYKVKLSLEDGGSKLDVRGYVGWSLFGRTQVWHRQSEPAGAATAE
ncbi:MAG TPA: DUF2147 domain-containing protein [Rhodanobacteraceae bacterium]|nr:DUF2147 domain-containing protein [Rhodanobacteraceae bacterium]